MQNSFRVFNDIICEGTAPSMHEAIVGIKRSPETILGSMKSMIEVPLDVYKHLQFSPMFDYTRAWITSRYELIFGLKNTESKLELFRFIRYGDEDLPSGARKNGSFPARMFVEGKASRLFILHRFGQLCFTTNRDNTMWRASQSDHINGDKYDNRKTNTRWLNGMENNSNYHEGRRMSDDGGGKRGGGNGGGKRKKGF